MQKINVEIKKRRRIILFELIEYRVDNMKVIDQEQYCSKLELAIAGQKTLFISIIFKSEIKLGEENFPNGMKEEKKKPLMIWARLLNKKVNDI